MSKLSHLVSWHNGKPLHSGSYIARSTHGSFKMVREANFDAAAGAWSAFTLAGERIPVSDVTAWMELPAAPSDDAVASAADKEPIYDSQISPLMKRIIDICKESRINFAACFSLGHDPSVDQTMFCTTVIDDIDPEDIEGVKRMKEIRAAMYPPAPKLYAFTIIGTKP